MKRAALMALFAFPCRLRLSPSLWPLRLRRNWPPIYVEPIAERDGYELRNS